MAEYAADDTIYGWQLWHLNNFLFCSIDFGIYAETAHSGGAGAEASCGIIYVQVAANAHHPVALLKVFIYFDHPMGT
jgi:hypothetical protein